MWFKKEAAAPHKTYKFEDFVESQPELPEDAPRLDVLELEVRRLQERVAELESLKSSIASTDKWIEEYFRKNIAKLAVDAAKQFDSALLAAEKADISSQIEQAVEQVFQREAQGLFQACVRAVLRQLGKGL